MAHTATNPAHNPRNLLVPDSPRPRSRAATGATASTAPAFVPAGSSALPTPVLVAAGAVTTPTAGPVRQSSVSDCRSGRSFSVTTPDGTPGASPQLPDAAPLPLNLAAPTRVISHAKYGSDGERSQSVSSLMEAHQELVGGRDEVTFVPFALYKRGDHHIHSRSVGWHSDGDIVVLKEEISSNSDSDMQVGAARGIALTDARRLEMPFAERKLEKRGLRGMPGVAGPRSKNKRRRWKNTYFIGDEEDRTNAGDQTDVRAAPGRMTKSEYQELFTHRPTSDLGFYNDDGDLQKAWLPFCEISMDRQDRLLSSIAPQSRGAPATQPAAVGWPRTPQQRVAALSKPLRLELARMNKNRPCFLPQVEGRLQEYLRNLAAPECSERRPLVLEFDDGYHRMLWHGVCSYYGVVSESHTEADGVRCTVAQLPGDISVDDALRCPTLAEHLNSNAPPKHCSGGQKQTRRKGAKKKR